jgi:hypothetical protein
MKRHRSNPPAGLLLAAAIVVTVALPAAADVKLELAVHEAARAARKQGFQNVLLVVREDIRSARDQEIGGVLRTLERLTAEALTLEPRVNPVVSRTVRIKAQSAKVRQAMGPPEFAAFRGTLDADAILALDYQKRRIANVRMTLLDAKGVYFSQTVRLSGRPQPDDDLFAAAMSAVDGDSQEAPADPEDKNAADGKTSAGSKKPGSGNPLKDAAADAKRDFPASGMVITKDLTGQRQVMRSSPRRRQIQAIIDTLNAEARRATATRSSRAREDAGQGAERAAAGQVVQGQAQARSGNGQDGHPANCPCRQGQKAAGSGGNGEAAGKPRKNCPLASNNQNGGTQPANAGNETRGGAGGAAGGGGNGGAGTTTDDQTPAPLPFDDLPQLNEGVLNFATNNIGNRIGRGECWDLADQALRAVGAEPAQGYTFGHRINVNDVIPGDILQFTSARFDEPGYWVVMGVPNHTAVVQAVGQDRLFILQQNFAGKRYVTTYDINPDSMTSGTLEAFRPRLPTRRR